MPTTNFQRKIYALITVIITVHAFVFYSLYVINGTALMQVTKASSVIGAINSQGGVYAFGTYLPIWAIIIIELILAYLLAIFMGSPLSFKLASKVFDIKKTNSVIFQTAIICATVGLMCPAMSFLASIIYYPYYAGFNIFTLLAEFLKLVCLNFPFAFFSQLFFIQPFVRTIFKKIFRKN